MKTDAWELHRSFVVSLIVVGQITAVHGVCTMYCNSGDRLSGSSCISTVTASNSCPSGFSPSGGQCVDAGAICSGIIPTMFANIGMCCYGTKMTPATTGTGSSCYPADGGPGGFYCWTSSTVGCYTSTRPPSSCPSGSVADGFDCVRSLTYTCPSGYTLSGTTCTSVYAASNIIAQGQCNIASPATEGCLWCSAINVCISNAASCPGNCLAAGQSLCVVPTSSCQWCSIGVCQNKTASCFSSCLAATVSPSVCAASSTCKYCSPPSSIGVCQPLSGTCYTSCVSASAEPTICGNSTSCKYCSIVNNSIGVCQLLSGTCYSTCLAASTEPNVCTGSASCKYCTEPSSTGVCQPIAGTCYATCLAASAEPSVCDESAACQWCGTTDSIGVCQPSDGTCWASCPPATNDPQGSGVCSTSQSCKWCPAAARGVGGIGVCQVRSGTCWTSCLSTATDPFNADVCGYSTECQWCPSSTSIGVCQPNAGTCWATCTPASDDPLGSGVCTTSVDCKWCPTLNYCTERTRDCHTLCTTVAPDEPAICQVQSIQAQCQWCGAPGSVEYCVAVTDETRLRCTASCSGLIWRPDVCDGALECHWCGVHNAAQGGRCKPLPGKSRGYVAWRREVECDTESETSSLSTPGSRSRSISSSSSYSLRTSTSESASQARSPSRTISVTHSTTASRSRSANTSASDEVTRSYSFSPLSITLMPTSSNSSTMTWMITRHTASDSLSGTLSVSSSTTKSASPTATHDLTATRYYSRDRTLAEAVAVYMAVSLSMTSVLSGSTMTSSLGRVIAARSVGQCWGPAGSSVFSLPVDVCGGTDNKDETQLEAYGDVVVSLGLVGAGVVGLVSCAAVYVAVKGFTWRSTMEKVSILSILTPLWVAVLPILVGGAVTATLAPKSDEHPLAFICGGSAGLVAFSFVLSILLLVVLAVVPLATPTLFSVACQRRFEFVPRAAGSSAMSLIVRWFRLSGQHGWSWKPLDSATTLSAHRMVRTLLLEYRALWYAALDSTDVCVVAILGAIGPFLQWSACVGSGAAVVVVLALQLLVSISSNPMSRPLDWYVGCVTLALTTASSTLRIVYGASTNDDEREERGVLLIVAASLDMVVSIVTFAPIVLDVAELLRYMLCKKAHSTGGGDIDDETSSTDAWYGGRQPSIELLPLKKGSDDDLTDEINFPLACAPSDDNLNDIDVFKVTNAFLELLSSSGDDAANVADSVLETQAVGVTMMPTDLLAAYHYSNSFE